MTDEITPLAAPVLPVHVVSGELIEAAWGNNVVTELQQHEDQLAITPKGRIAAVNAPATNQTGIGATATDITGASLVWTVVAGRSYLLTGQFVVASTEACTWHFDITDGANILQTRLSGFIAAATAFDTIALSFPVIGHAPGAHGLKARFQVTIGSGTVYANGYLMVEDIGV